MNELNNIKVLNIKRYFGENSEYDENDEPNENEKMLYYNINYTIHEYKQNKFYLSIDIEQDGYYESTEEYYFDDITKITKTYDEDYESIKLKVDFITYPSHIDSYEFSRFFRIDANKIHKFLVDNIIFGKGKELMKKNLNKKIE